MGVAAPRLALALGLTRDQLGPVFSASLIGLLLGALIVGRLSDRFGRKWALILSLIAYGVFSAATAWSHDLTQLLAVRVLAGLGLGGAMPTLVALSSEALAFDGAPAARRSRVVTMLTSGMPFGGAIAGGVAAMTGWREIFIMGGLAPLVIAAAMVPLLPESHVFAAARREAEVRPGLLWTLFAEKRAVTTLVLWTASFCALLSHYMLLNWLPILMGARGVSRHDGSLVSLFYNIGGGLGVLVLAALLERRRADRTVVVWYAAMAVAVVGLALSGGNLASAGGDGFLRGRVRVVGDAVLLRPRPVVLPDGGARDGGGRVRRGGSVRRDRRPAAGGGPARRGRRRPRRADGPAAARHHRRRRQLHAAAATDAAGPRLNGQQRITTLPKWLPPSR